MKANAHPDPAARREAICEDRTSAPGSTGKGPGISRCTTSPKSTPSSRRSSPPTPRPPTTPPGRPARRGPRRLPRRRPPRLARPAASGRAVPKGASGNDVKTFLHIDLSSLLRGRSSPGRSATSTASAPSTSPGSAASSATASSSPCSRTPTAPSTTSSTSAATPTPSNAPTWKPKAWCCAVPGCGATHGLELDHVDDWADTYQTEVDSLAWLCGHDHDLKTHHGHASPDTRRPHWTRPDGITITASDHPLAESPTCRATSAGSGPRRFSTPAPA